MNQATYSNNIESLVEVVLRGIADRERDVLKKRFGLDAGGVMFTLAAIGDRYEVTRERIRQIEAGALALARKNARSPAVEAFAEQAVRLVKDAGGVLKEEALLVALRGATSEKTSPREFENSAKFILEVSGKLFPHREDDVHHAFWYLTKGDVERLRRYLDKLVSAAKTKKGDLLGVPNQFGTFVEQAAKPFRMGREAGMQWVAISKRFTANAYGDWGLVEWPEANPRTARDWAYLVLKREKRPLHFTDLASMVGKFRKGKATNTQTVHNELIKDERFVLVGRGTYGLAEFGVLPGTAREVISHFLKKQGPLKFSELMKSIARERVFKESTILINLQNKGFFKKTDDGRYALREA